MSPTPTPPPSYPTDAACATSDLPPGTWDENVHGETARQKQTRIATAVAVCGTCPVADACYAARNEGGGIRAGHVLRDYITGYDSNTWAGIAFIDRAQEDACGTHRGYARHWRAGQDACDDCKAANTAYVKATKAAKARRHAA